MLLMDFFMSNAGSATGVQRTDEDMVWWALILGNVFQSYFLVYVFGKIGNINSFGSGFQLGAVLGLILGLGIDLTMYGTSNTMNLTSAIVDPFVGAVMLGVTGGVIGAVLGRK
jgi:hypothetical protein